VSCGCSVNRASILSKEVTMKKMPILLLAVASMFFATQIWAKSCSSDYSCSYGQSCVKDLYKSNGVCMTNVNKNGTKTFAGPKSSSIGIRSYGDAQCRYNTDCPIGFDCDRSSKVCVKD